MRTLTQVCLAVAVILLLPFFLVLRLFGWRPAGQTGMQSLFPHEPRGNALVSAEKARLSHTLIFTSVMTEVRGNSAEPNENI
jgi:hypothetical protein